MKDICAVSTPLAEGGISVIRISGEKAISIGAKVFKPLSCKSVENMAGYSCAYGKIVDKNGREVDDGVLTVFRSPKSYTGENVCEISCHGGIYVTKKVLRLCIEQGAELAQRGEFTKRAFLNGKLSLTQAEGVMETISAQGEYALNSANLTKEGRLFRLISDMSRKFVTILGELAAWVDYPEEDLPVISEDNLRESLKNALAGLDKIIADHDSGMILKNGVDTVIAGKPNVGKSTLLSRVTNAEPKIANYHFTTLSPNLGVVDLEGCSGFVIADIPGLIEGASEGVGLGHEFLRHIERTRVMIHVVDVASTEGRDPVDDINKINKELEAYNPEIAKRPQIIAANKTDAIYVEEGEEDPVERLKKEFEPKGIPVYPISAVSGKGLKELLYAVQKKLDELPKERMVFEQEFFPEDMLLAENLPYTVEQDPEDEHRFIIEGPKIEKMLGYTNLDSEKGFAFFQRFLKDTGILDELEQAGIQEGDTVKMYGFEFDYYK